MQRRFAVSTLRGQKADNRLWSQDPLAPAIIIGTVDMIGSRLLFRGYRDGKYHRPYHAGLLGVDTLVVNDEAHLSPAFAGLLKTIAGMQPARELHKQFRVLFVSATERGVGERRFDHDIEVDARSSKRFDAVYGAEKLAHLHEAAEAEDKMFDLTMGDPSKKRVIVFIERPEKAFGFAERIRKRIGEAEPVVLLTGTMRGLERDKLGDHETFQKFQQRSAASGGPFYLVSTSAGEVGIDISGELMVTELRASDTLMQRLGRLNRFGDQDGEAHRTGEAHIVYAEKKLAQVEREAKTLEYLRQLPRKENGAIDVSCRAFRQNPPPEDTFSPVPLLAILDNRLIDLWSQTSGPSVGAPAMPRVENWLHGKQEDRFETAVAWRAEVDYLAAEGISERDRQTVLERYRVLPRETLKELTGRLREKLTGLPEEEQGRRVLFQDSEGSVSACTISELTDEKKWLDFDLADGLLVLPEGCGWLSSGMFRQSPSDGCYAGDDVADGSEEEGGEAAGRNRYLAERGKEGWDVRELKSADGIVGLSDWRDGLRRKGGRLLKITLPPKDSEEEERLLIFQTGINRATATKSDEVSLEDHLEHVEKRAREITRLAWPAAEETFGLAGRIHDKGKDCDLWQSAMGGDAKAPLAKTKKPVNPSLLRGYRHELGSLLRDAEGAGDDDLLLHLVASHHGWARPYWEKNAYDQRSGSHDNARATLEAVHRFSRLQRKWGPWGLAYLEALFKAADGMASRQEERGWDE